MPNVIIKILTKVYLHNMTQQIEIKKSQIGTYINSKVAAYIIINYTVLAIKFPSGISVTHCITYYST